MLLRSPWRAARRALAAAAVACGLAAAPSAADAQVSWRVQTAWLDAWEPAVALGADYRVPLGGSALPEPGGDGPMIVETGNWVLMTQLSVGVTFAETGHGDVSPTALGSLGVLRRLDGVVDRAGVVAFGAVRPEALGPMVRVEAMDALGLQAGWVWLLDSGGRDGPAVTVDVSIGFLSDLFR